jgi:hypothetical protein
MACLSSKELGPGAIRVGLKFQKFSSDWKKAEAPVFVTRSKGHKENPTERE